MVEYLVYLVILFRKLNLTVKYKLERKFHWFNKSENLTATVVDQRKNYVVICYLYRCSSPNLWITFPISF